MNNTTELFGDFVSAPSLPPPSINRPAPLTLNQLSQNSNPYRDIIDNNTLYKKLIDIEIELKFIKTMMINHTAPIYASPPTPLLPPKNNYSPIKETNSQDLPKIWTSPSTSLRKFI